MLMILFRATDWRRNSKQIARVCVPPRSRFNEHSTPAFAWQSIDAALIFLLATLAVSFLARAAPPIATD